MPEIGSATAIILILAAVALIFLVRRKLTAQKAPSSDIGDAQRFAKLLVAEIKLYNEEKLESAQRAGTIYQELKTEIDQAREMYENRIFLHEGFGRDFFYEELVNSLASGDSLKLGPGYQRKGTVH